MSFKVKHDSESDEHYIDFADLAYLFDQPELVDSCEMDWNEDGSCTMQFFDKDGNVIKVREK